VPGLGRRHSPLVPALTEITWRGGDKKNSVFTKDCGKGELEPKDSQRRNGEGGRGIYP